MRHRQREDRRTCRHTGEKINVACMPGWSCRIAAVRAAKLQYRQLPPSQGSGATSDVTSHWMLIGGLAVGRGASSGWQGGGRVQCPSVPVTRRSEVCRPGGCRQYDRASRGFHQSAQQQVSSLAPCSRGGSPADQYRPEAFQYWRPLVCTFLDNQHALTACARSMMQHSVHHRWYALDVVERDPPRPGRVPGSKASSASMSTNDEKRLYTTAVRKEGG